MSKQKLLTLLAVVMAIIMAVGSASAATMSTSYIAPAINGYDIANYGTVTGNDKWFAEDSAAGAVKGQTFITGSDDVVLNSITYQVTDTQQAEATKTYMIRVGIVSGNTFTEIYSEEATQDFKWNSSEYMTWTFDLPVLLDAGTEYGIDVGMTASTSGWQTGIPYINMTADEYADGVRYTSGTSGIGTDTVALDASKDRIFHIDMSSVGSKVLYPKNREVVPPGEVPLEWINLDPNGATETYVDVWFGTDPNKVSGPGNGTYTKIVNGESISSFAVTPDGPGVYYWQIDSYTHGKPTTAGGTVDYSTGDPCMIEGAIYVFTNDGPIASVDLGPDMVTWSGEPVDLIADVNDDGGSALTYAWTVDSMPSGVTAVFDPSAYVAAPSVTITKAPTYSNANIINAGFEADQQGEDGWGGSPGWTAIGRMGNWNPPVDAYDGSAVPEGVMCAWAQTRGNGLAQVLTETLAADTDYTLTVEVGNSNRYDWTGYKVQLLAGGTVIAEDDNTVSPALGAFATSTVNYSYAPEDANKVGLPLEIRLIAGDLVPDGTYAECNFDAVQLTADPAFPAKAGVVTVDVTATVNDVINPAVSDTMTIEVYDDACEAARIGLDLDTASDFNKNCQVYPEDLATMAANWLNDEQNLDEAVVSPGLSWPGNIFSVSFYRFGAAMDTPEEQAKMLLTEDEAAGYGDWLTTGWANIECGWAPDGIDEDPDILTSTGGSTASFYFHDTRNGNNYNDNLDAMVDGGNAEMMEGHGNGTLEDPANPDKIFHIEVTDIPFSAYDLIFYIGTQQAQEGDGTGQYSLNGAPYADFARPIGRFDGTFDQVNDDSGDVTGNYILYEGVTGSSFDFKIHGTGFNHIGLSGFQVRERDPNAPVISAGDSMITWLGEPVTLNATVDGTSSLWNMEDVTSSWTADEMPGFDITLSDPAQESLTVTISRIIPYWWEIPIYNSSFESPLLTPDGQMKWFTTGETSWRFADPDGINVEFDPLGKGYFGQLLLWNPKAGLVHGGGWNKAGMDGIVPDGDNCVIVGSYLRVSSGGGTDEDARSQPGGLAKLLITGSGDGDNNVYPTYDPTASYELSAYIGHDGLYWDRYYGYKVELLAGGTNERSSDQYTDKVVGGTVIGSVESTEPLDPNTWELATVSVGPSAANADLAGEPLQIRITALKDPADPTAGKFIIVDDVKLKTDSPPALHPLTMQFAVTEGSTGNTVTSSTFIDLYENPCDAAVAANPGMEFNLGDITEDCITNMSDLAILASDWLKDYELTGPQAKPE